MANPPCLFDSLAYFHSSKTAITELTDLIADSLSVLTVFAKWIALLRTDQIVCLMDVSLGAPFGCSVRSKIISESNITSNLNILLMIAKQSANNWVLVQHETADKLKDQSSMSADIPLSCQRTK
jgi:hypothetical protein